MHLPLARDGDIELLGELDDALVGALVGDDDELVGPLVGDDLRDRHRLRALAPAALGRNGCRSILASFAPAGRRRCGRRRRSLAALGRLEDLEKRALELLSVRVLDLIHVDLFLAAGHVEQVQNPEQPLEVEPVLRDDQRAGRLVGDNLRLRRLHGVDDRLHGRDGHMLELHDMGDHLVVRRDIRTAARRLERLPACALGLHNLEEVPEGDGCQPVHPKGSLEGPVGIADRDRLRRDDGDLLAAADGVRDDEIAASQR